jgi:hypothetical protein
MSTIAPIKTPNPTRNEDELPVPPLSSDPGFRLHHLIPKTSSTTPTSIRSIFESNMSLPRFNELRNRYTDPFVATALCAMHLPCAVLDLSLAVSAGHRIRRAIPTTDLLNTILQAYLRLAAHSRSRDHPCAQGLHATTARHTAQQEFATVAALRAVTVPVPSPEISVAMDRADMTRSEFHSPPVS